MNENDLAPLPEGEPVLRVVPMPSDANYAGDICARFALGSTIPPRMV
jgi:hypothetical protein